MTSYIHAQLRAITRKLNALWDFAEQIRKDLDKYISQSTGN